MSLESRFWRKVNKTDSCWLWTAGRRVEGYGVFSPNRRTIGAHRFVFELNGTPVGQNEEVHHVCPNKHCVRIHPQHLVIVPKYFNPDSPAAICRLKTHSKRGHEFTDSNTIIERTADGKVIQRRCRSCDKQAGRIYWRYRRKLLTSANHVGNIPEKA